MHASHLLDARAGETLLYHLGALLHVIVQRGGEVVSVGYAHRDERGFDSDRRFLKKMRAPEESQRTLAFRWKSARRVRKNAELYSQLLLTYF